MPNARIITSRPELADPVADSLRQSGYAVEVTTPERASFQPVDLEMNLDRCDSTPRVHQPGEQDVTFAGASAGAQQNQIYSEDQYQYDRPYVVEREFVLKPLWRKFKANMAQMFGRNQAEEDVPVSMSFLGLDPEEAQTQRAVEQPRVTGPQRVPDMRPQQVIQSAPEPVMESVMESAPEPVMEPVAEAMPIQHAEEVPIKAPLYETEPLPLSAEPVEESEEVPIKAPMYETETLPLDAVPVEWMETSPEHEPEAVKHADPIPLESSEAVSTENISNESIRNESISEPVTNGRSELERVLAEQEAAPVQRKSESFEDTRSDLHPEWHEQFEHDEAAEAQQRQQEVQSHVAPTAEEVPVIAAAPMVPLHAAYSELDSQPLPQSEVKPAKPAVEAAPAVPKERKTPALVTAAMALEQMRDRAAHKFVEWRTRPRADSKQPVRDYVWRQAFPAAAGLALAFLIGWTAAVHSSANQQQATTTKGQSAGAPVAGAPVAQRAGNSRAGSPGFTVGPNAPAPSGGYTVGPQVPQANANPAPAASTTVAPAANAPLARKPSPASPRVTAKRSKPTMHRRRVYSDDTADDVVVHHYSTTKPKVPEIHRASLKKYSDLD